MEDRNIRIFQSDIEVPPVVLEKADAAFAQIKREQMKEASMKKTEKKKTVWIVRTAAAAAACLVVFGGIGMSGWLGKGQEDPEPAQMAEGDAAMAEKDVAMAERADGMEETEAAKDTAAPAAETSVQKNPFVLTAHAEELAPGKPVPLNPQVSNAGQGWVLDGIEGSSEEGGGEGSVSFCINTDFFCQGDDIERVGYSINKGAFQVVQPINPDERILVEGTPYEGELKAGIIGGGYDEAAEEEQPQLYETALYQSFVLDYDRQSAENTWINVCNNLPDDGTILELIWAENGSLEQANEGINRMLEGTVITCTAYYTDGSTASVEIGVSCRMMTYAEAGEPQEEGGIPGDTESNFIVFEMR